MTDSAADGEIEREQAMYALAAQLFFRVEKRAGRYSLCRQVDVREPVVRDDLTLAEAEELLGTWKMRGAHGG
jgi:hypothetical protein